MRRKKWLLDWKCNDEHLGGMVVWARTRWGAVRCFKREESPRLVRGHEFGGSDRYGSWPSLNGRCNPVIIKCERLKEAR